MGPRSTPLVTWVRIEEHALKKVDLFQPLFFEGLLRFVQINTKYNTGVTITRLIEKLQNKSTYNP